MHTALAIALLTVQLAGPVVTTVADGDVIFPRFSPNGKTLAYVRVTVVDGVERDEIVLRDLRSGRTVTLLDAKAAERYETYSAYIVDLTWIGPERLEAVVADGDVDAVAVVFDTRKRRIVREEPTPSVDDDEGEGPFAWRPELNDARNQALAAFPDIAPADLDSGLAASPILTPDGRLVYQKANTIDDNAVWLLDLKARTRRVLVPRSEGLENTLKCGTWFGSSMLLFLETSSTSRAVLVGADGQMRELGSVGSIALFAEVEVRYRSASRIVFLVRQYRGADRGDNPLVTFDGQHLVRVFVEGDLADADVSPDGRLAAFCLWKDDHTRQIVVRRAG